MGSTHVSAFYRRLVEVLLYVSTNRRFISNSDGSPGRPTRLSRALFTDDHFLQDLHTRSQLCPRAGGEVEGLGGGGELTVMQRPHGIIAAFA